MHTDIIVAPFEVKFAADQPDGTFTGYAAVFGNVDSHGDVIMPGAFNESIAEYKTSGGVVPMHLMHGIFGGDGLPVGVFTDLEEDSKGLKATGKISGVNTDAGRLLYERVKDRAFGGLSIGYKVRKGGAAMTKGANGQKRTLTSVDLREISLVTDPSNAQAIIKEVKARKAATVAAAGAGDETEADPNFVADSDEAIERIANAIIRQDSIMQSYSGSYYGSAKTAALLMDDLRCAYFALTGVRAPDGVEGWTKCVPTIREIERVLREECKLSRSQASEIAARRFTSQTSGEGSAANTTPEVKQTLAQLDATLSGFKLPTFG